MLSIKATYEDGQVRFPDEHLPQGRMEVIVTFLMEQPPVEENAQKGAGKRFVEKWAGILKGVDIEGWQDQRADDILRTHA